MASPGRNSRLSTPDNGGDIEPFPAMPDSSPAGPSSYHQPTTTTTTTVGPTITTTTTYSSRNRPYTITSAQPTTNVPLSTSTSSLPTTVVSTTNPAAGSAITRTSTITPSQANRQRPIGIRRLPSSNLRSGYEAGSSATDLNGAVNRSSSGRGRSTSAPQNTGNLTVPGQNNNLTRQSTRQSLLASVAEHPGSGDSTADRGAMGDAGAGGIGRRRSVSNAARSVFSRFSDNSRERQEPEYETEVVDLLDVLGRKPARFEIDIC